MIRITMPRASQSMEEGVILRWRKQEGESVDKGEVLVEIETDKATFEVEAPESGILRRILRGNGETVPVLVPIGILAGLSEEIGPESSSDSGPVGRIAAGSPSGVTEAPPPSSGTVSEPADGQPVMPILTGERVRASPLARRIAKERDLDLAALWPGSGPNGRVVVADLDRVAAPAIVSGEPVARKMSSMRSAIARSVAASKQKIPHFYTRLTIDAGPLQVFHRAARSKYPCTITDIIALACARVMREFPAFRSRLEGEVLWEHAGANVGLVVGMDDGLRVPVLTGVERMSLPHLAGETRRIIEAAHQGKVEAMGQGQFTISNLGMYGVEEFAAIINPPESAILAVGAIRESVIVKDGSLRPGSVMTLTLSADHRVIDGILAARFLGRLKALLEAPECLDR